MRKKQKVLILIVSPFAKDIKIPINNKLKLAEKERSAETINAISIRLKEIMQKLSEIKNEKDFLNKKK